MLREQRLLSPWQSIFSKLNNNERTLIFVAFTAEEIGEFGSAYFFNLLKYFARVITAVVPEASSFAPL